MSLYSELRRRNVFRVAAAYVIAAWVIAQVASTVAEPLNLPEWFESLVLVLLAVGFPIALLLGWVFELTSEGVKTSTAEFPPSQGRSRLVDFGLMLSVLILAGVTVWDRLESSSEVTGLVELSIPIDKSIAVLPFADMSPAGNQEYFGDGIAEEILNELTELDGLQVASRTSSFSFKDTNTTTTEIGRTLNVNMILEGSVRMNDNRLRVTAQLIDVASGYHHWSEIYDRELDDLFAVQEEIASSVAAVLGVTLGVGDVNSFRGAGTDSFEAYSFYLRAQNEPNPQQQISLLERAITLDPDYAAAISSVGLAYANSMWTSPVEQAPELLERAGQYLRRAVSISPESAYGYSLLATANYGQFNFIESEEYFNRALAIDQDGLHLANYGNMLMRAGKSTVANRYYELASSADESAFPPGPLQLNAAVALSDYARAENIVGGYPPGFGTEERYRIALNQNDIPRVQALLEQLVETEPAAYLNFTPILESLDSPEIALSILRSLYADTATSWPSKYHDIALLAAFLGDPEFALEVFSTEVRLTAIRYGALWYPVMNEVRQLPAFKDLMREVNLVEYWRTHGWPDHCRPLGTDDFECY